MTELSDYRRIVEGPMNQAYEQKIAGLRARAESAEASLAKVVEGLERIDRAWSVVATQSEAKLMLLEFAGSSTLSARSRRDEPHSSGEGR